MKNKNKRIQYKWMTILYAMLIISVVSCNVLPKDQADGRPSSGQPSEAPQQTGNGAHGENNKDNVQKPNPSAVAKLTFSQAEIVVTPGSETTLPYAMELEDATSPDSKPISAYVSFVSDAPEWLSVDAEGTIRIAQSAEIGDMAKITAIAGKLQAECTVVVKYALADTVDAVAGQDIPVVTNASSTAVVVNKSRSLPDGFTPDDLVEPNVPFSFSEKLEKRKLRKPAADALELLFAKAKEDGIRLNAVSGYRSFNTQSSLFNWNVNHYGEEHARKYVAFPGTSEHQTGLAMDVSSPSVGNALEESLADTKEGQWLAEHAADFGFIIRYPKGKEHITGYAYEPWHLRYVGEKIARPIMEQGITLEEYFPDAVPVSR